jgi:hypothetical protein
MDPSLHLDSSNHELSFLAPPFSFLGSNQLIFPSEIGARADYLALICHFLVLDPSSKKALDSIYYGSHLIKIALFDWTLDLGSSSKVALRLSTLVDDRSPVHLPHKLRKKKATLTWATTLGSSH